MNNRRSNNPLSKYVPDCHSLELAMERYCKLHWSTGSTSGSSPRRTSSEPTAAGLVDSGRSSLTSYGSEESLSADEFEVFSDCYSEFEDDEDRNGFDLRLFDHLWSEWKIPVKDITIHRNHQIVDSKTRQIKMRGYWHGAVMVYQRSLVGLEEKKEFVSEVGSLCKIRHENIQLFMGVCIDMPGDNVAVVMSELKGETIHSHLNKYGHRFTRLNKLRILRQIAEGMEYLHAKGISHGSLSTDIITYQHRVCISMSAINKRTRTLDSADITYLPAEDIQKIYLGGLNSRQLTLSTQSSFTSDIFAYGTIVYELMTLSRPYPNCSLIDLIWKLGNQDYQSLDAVPKGRFRSVISRCWSALPNKRLSFKKILSLVQDDSNILGKYSTVQFHHYSVPSHLCSLGGSAVN